MRALDSVEIEKKNGSEIRELKKWLKMLKEKSFNDKASLHRDFEKAEAAVQQRFLNLSQLFSSSGDAQLNNETSITPNINIDTLISETTDNADLEMKLYLPLLNRQAQGWTGHLRRSTIPRNREFFDIKFDWHEKLSANFPEIVPVLEAAWKDYLKSAFNRTKAVGKITKSQLQSVIYGNTAMYLEYSEDLGMIDAFVINPRNVAVSSAKDDINRSKLMVEYTVPITDLLDNPALDNEIIDELQASVDLQTTNLGYLTGDDDTDTVGVEYGNIAVCTFFIPYWSSRKNPKFKFKNLLITIAEGQSKEKEPRTVILRMMELESREQNPILFSTFGPTPEGVVYYQSKILQNLPYQAMANLATSTAMQALLISVFPPLKVIDDGTMTADSYNWYPRAIWSIRTKDDIEQMTIQSDLNAYIAVMNFIEAQVQKSGGITEVLQGARSTAVRKTAFEVEQEKQAGSVPIDYIIEHQSDTLLQPFVFKYSLLAQVYIEAEVENLLSQIKEQEKKEGSTQDELTKWQFIRSTSKMFRNFLIYSKIESKLDNKIKEIAMLNPERAGELVKLNNPAFLYDLIIAKFSEANVIIVGNSAEAEKREMKEDLLEFLQLAPNLGIEQTTGKRMDGNEVLAIMDKVFNLPLSKMFKIQSELQQQNPLATAQAAAAGGQAPQGDGSAAAPIPNPQLPPGAAPPPAQT